MRRKEFSDSWNRTEGIKVTIIERDLIFAISNLTESEERGTPCFHVGLYDSLEFRQFAWPCAPLHPPSMAEAVEQVDRGAPAGRTGTQRRPGDMGPATPFGIVLS